MFEENRVSGSVVGNQHLKPDTKNKVLLIDADTIAYAVCVVIEEGDEDVGFSIDLDYALTVAKEKIDLICDLTGVKDVELHFTGKDNFRYHIDDNYKSNRVGTRTPAGLFELKQLLINEYDKAYSHIGYEADDVVAMLKRTQPDKYILCAVDKDVLNGIAGVHFNYYKNDRFNISMKWVETTQKEAMKFPYIQCLTGDSSDGIKGVPNIGPKKAEKALKKHRYRV
jgi:DNA polymerase-1